MKRKLWWEFNYPSEVVNVSAPQVMIKEVFGMTEIGRMIREDGIREGKEEGKAEGKAEMLITLLTKRFNKIPIEYVEKIMKLPQTTIDVIATEIFDLNSISDLEKYL